MPSFSEAYNIGVVQIETTKKDRAVVSTQLYYELVDHDPKASVGDPIYVKVGTVMVPVYGEDGVPAQTLAMPHHMIQNHGFTPHSKTEVLVLKRDHAKQYVDWMDEIEALRFNS